MTRFTQVLIEQLRIFIQSDCEYEEESQNERSNSSDLNNNLKEEPIFKSLPNIKKNICPNSHSKNYTTNSTSNDNSSSPKNKIAHDIGIDELVEYIEKKDENKQKKNKKRANKKKKNNKKEEKRNLETACVVNEELDREVEFFKKMLSESSLKEKVTKKIRPVISQDWLTSIVKLVNQVS